MLLQRNNVRYYQSRERTEEKYSARPYNKARRKQGEWEVGMGMGMGM